MRIGDVEIGTRVFVVAEVGSNHNGDFAVARELVRAAAQAGADAVKFQVYRGDRLVQKDQATLSHVRGLHRTQRERFQRLEFIQAQWEELAGVARDAGIVFFASVFDEESADRMDPLMPAFKIASGDLTNLPLLRHVAKKGKPVILSTGMATVEEIAEAIEVLPQDRLVLLHCVSSYPTPLEEANLRAIPFLRERFAVPAGYSDHTTGITACLAAVALGAVALEKHFTFDKSQLLGDHRLSADPNDLARLVSGVREIERALGRPEKVPGETERRMREAMRRSLYTRRALPAGALLEAEDVICLRPAGGLPPSALDRVIGRRVRRPLAAEELLREEDLEEV